MSSSVGLYANNIQEMGTVVWILIGTSFEMRPYKFLGKSSAIRLSCLLYTSLKEHVMIGFRNRKLHMKQHNACDFPLK